MFKVPGLSGGCVFRASMVREVQRGEKALGRRLGKLDLLAGFLPLSVFFISEVWWLDDVKTLSVLTSPYVCMPSCYH